MTKIEEAMYADPPDVPSPVEQTHTMDRMLEEAEAKGWRLAILYQMPNGRWHARFERRTADQLRRDPTKINGLLMTGSFLFGDTAHAALAKAFEDTYDPGASQRREQVAVLEKWTNIRAMRGDPDPVTPADKVDVKPLKALLRGDNDLEFRLLQALGLNVEERVYSLVTTPLDGDDDEEWI